MTTISPAPTPASGAPGTLHKIEFEEVTKTYRTDSGDSVQALASTTLSIDEGEFVCIVGPSGCGKSTLMQMLAGFHQPTTGRVLADGAPVVGPDRDRGVVFQQANLYPWLTTRANVELGPRMRGVAKAERRAVADQYLEMVGLTKFADRKPYELSGGMQQRAQIARVLANAPDVILMDEPFGALDALTRERMQMELTQIWRERRTTVVFITHDVEEAIFLGTRVLVMTARPGRLMMDLPVQLTSDGVAVPELRSQANFIELRDTVTEAIYRAQDGATQ
ncbi:ABC transporter ATP-binding protein [Kocuria marina]|uniref:ABC transporter ATP-binding protein n=1 Tax=Kocuria TaxID=57493 RepID=UPI001873E1AF|nr:ABC transporter ATP-binding protein [Kocuria marina]